MFNKHLNRNKVFNKANYCHASCTDCGFLKIVLDYIKTVTDPCEGWGGGELGLFTLN